MLEIMIAELKNTDAEGLMSRSRVIDHLLDIRIACDENQAMRARVDDLLSHVPGKSSVEASWWHDALDDLGGLASPTPVG